MTEVEVWRTTSKEGNTVGLFVDPSKITEVHIERTPFIDHLSVMSDGFTARLTLAFEYNYLPEWRKIDAVTARVDADVSWSKRMSNAAKTREVAQDAATVAAEEPQRRAWIGF